MKALVTGASGFIGRFLVPFLLAKDVSVRVLVRHLSENIFSDKVEQHVGDLTDINSLTGAVQDMDVVFHLGGYAHATAEEAKHQQINLQGTQFIFQESLRANVKKFVFFSTLKAVADTHHCIDETFDRQPNTAYGKAKRAAEDFVLSQGRQHHMPVCVLRLALVYGPGLKGNLHQMLRAIDKGYFLPIPPVQNYRSLVSIYDVCQAAWLAAQRDEANGRIYFVANKETYSTQQIYQWMRVALGRSASRWRIPLWVFKGLAWLGDQGGWLLRRSLPFNSQAFDKLFGSAQCSSGRIQKELGFCPEYSLLKLLPEIVQAYRAGKY